MRIGSYSDKQLEWLRINWPLMELQPLTERFNAEFSEQRSPSSIRACLKNHKIRCGRKTGASNRGKYTVMPAGAAELVKKTYQDLSRKKLTELVNDTFGIGITVSQLTAFVKNHRIRSGRDGRFKKGHVSANKGTKGLTSRNRTSFLPGQIPANSKPLWHERVNMYGYVEISVPEQNPYTGSPTRYRYKHVWIWEQSNGPKPKGHAIVFKDGDNRNFDLDNLMLVSNRELICMNLNGYKNAPEPLKPALLALSKIEARAGFRHKKQ